MTWNNFVNTVLAGVAVVILTSCFYASFRCMFSENIVTHCYVRANTNGPIKWQLWGNIEWRGDRLYMSSETLGDVIEAKEIIPECQNH